MLADNLVVMLFFWEGLLLLLFAMISQTGGSSAFRTAIKAFIIVGIADLCMMIGIAIIGRVSGTLNISQISLIPQGLAGVAFILLMLGAIAKAGSMPYHTWIPEAAIDAPLPFMAFFPAALEKLLGIYFLTRICLTSSSLIPLQLKQPAYDYRRGYHNFSRDDGPGAKGLQTAFVLSRHKPGRLYDLRNRHSAPRRDSGRIVSHAQQCLIQKLLIFYRRRSRKQAGTTDLRRLGGLAKQMPVTFACFVVAAVSISGVPPFNGFFSKELIYDAALQRGMIFYLAALIGSFFTAASFLKLGHAAFLDKSAEPKGEVKEAPMPMLISMLVLAVCCIFFGVFNHFPLSKFFQPVLGEHAQGHTFSGFPANMLLVVVTVAVLLAALLHHIAGVKIRGSGLHAVDHIYQAPLLNNLYTYAEKKYFDLYELGVKAAYSASGILWGLDRFINWLYDRFIAGLSRGVSLALRGLHNGNYVTYIVWALIGAGSMLYFLAH